MTFPRRIHIITTTGFVFLFCFSCRKDEEPANPYSSLIHVVKNDNPGADAFPNGGFAWLHAKIFKPTCANSGCHDGTFEPEFRSLAGAYNTLVNHPVITNTEDDAFTYRVVPGDTSLSLLHYRLLTGEMPAIIDPGSDFPANKGLYLRKINEWIQAGAKDIYGNPAPAANVDTPPMVYGLVIFPHDNITTPFPRESQSIYGIGAIEVPAGLVDVWILPSDDNALYTGFTSVAMKASTSVSDFSGAIQSVFALSSPITALAFGDTPVPFYYKATLDLSGAASGTTYYLRNYINDGVQQELTEVPNDSSNPFWFLVYSIKVQ